MLKKLAAIGGTGPLKQREWRIRCRLGWHDKAASVVRHMLHKERQPSLQEAKEIEAAYLRYCAERIRANEAENVAIVSAMRAALAAMEASDPDFFEPTIKAVGEMLLQRRAQALESGRQNTGEET